MSFITFYFYSLFSFQGTKKFTALLNALLHLKELGGLKWTRTTDLTLIRRAL